MRRALLVGIDDYPAAPLAGCVHDVGRLAPLLSTHHDGSPNFDCRLLVSDQGAVTRAELRKAVEALFAQPADVALLFFAGHGTHNNLGGHLVTQDATEYDDGVSMTDVLTFVARSEAKDVIILLDCCHSGALGTVPSINPSDNSASLRHGVSILTASRATEPAAESHSGGVFTALVCDALDGSAADVCGKVTTAAVYAYVDQALGAWEQRPLFKAHVSTLCAIRRASPSVRLEVLRMLPGYFPSSSAEFALNPSHEPSADPRDAEHERAFRHLQQYRDAGLVQPVGVDHMYDAAMQSKSCKLTGLGRYYWIYQRFSGCAA